MATYNWGVDLPFKAAVDLDSYQYRFVKAGSVVGEVTYAATLGASVIGVLQNDPRAGEEATVRMLGSTKVYADASASALIYGSFVKTGSLGEAIGAYTPTACTIYVSGIAMESLASGTAMVEIMLVPSVRFA